MHLPEILGGIEIPDLPGKKREVAQLVEDFRSDVGAAILFGDYGSFREHLLEEARRRLREGLDGLRSTGVDGEP